MFHTKFFFFLCFEIASQKYFFKATILHQHSMVKKVTRKQRNNRIEEVEPSEVPMIVDPEVQTTRADLPTQPSSEDHNGLTEEQMKENIRAGARDLRELVDRYQEQHRVMQEEVAEAVIRDVQEQNQLHRLTATVLRAQQASLQDPAYTRWAFTNNKGEFSTDEIAAQSRAMRYRDPEDDHEEVASNKSASRAPSSYNPLSPQNTVGSPNTHATKYDIYVSEANKWMKVELDRFRFSSSSSPSSTNSPLAIILDAVPDRATLSFIKGYRGSTNEISKVPLPPTAVLSPVIPPAERAAQKLKEFLATTSTNFSTEEDTLYVPFVNGSILWPKLPSEQEINNECSALARGIVMLGQTSPTHVFYSWLLDRFEKYFGPKELTIRIPDDETQAKANDRAGSLSQTFLYSLQVATEALLEGEGIPLLREEGNILTMVPVKVLSTFPFVVCRTFTFKGITKAIDVVGTPQNINPFQQIANSAGTIEHSIKHALLKSVSSLQQAEDELQSSKPSNIVRTFLLPLSLLSVSSDSSAFSSNVLSHPLLIDARALSPSIPFASYSGALSWTDLCGLARAEIGASSPEEDTNSILLRMPISLTTEKGHPKYKSNAIPILVPYDSFSEKWFAPLNEAIRDATAMSEEKIKEESQIQGAQQEERTQQLGSSRLPLHENQNVNEKGSSASKKTVELTPATLAALSVGVGMVAVVCASAGYILAKKK